MTEAEWSCCDDPRAMLAGALGDRAAERRARLFVLACCRRVWGAKEDAATQVALAAAERFAAGGLGKMLREVVRVPRGAVKLDCTSTESVDRLDLVGEDGGLREVDAYAVDAILRLALNMLACSHFAHRVTTLPAFLLEAGLPFLAQAEIMREVMCGPFRPIAFRAEWRTCNDAAVLHIAAEIERAEAFGLLPLLADALMDAGCDSDELLAHLQRPGGHVRGCWGLDVVLGRY